MRIRLKVEALNLSDEDEAVFNYAEALKDLGLEVDICTFKQQPEHTQKGIQRMCEKFDVHFYQKMSNLSWENVDILYSLESGILNYHNYPVPHLIHAHNDASQPFGHRFASTSNWLARRDECLDVVPFIVNSPSTKEDYRKKLKISKDEIVIGRYGPWEDFSLSYIKEAIVGVLSTNDNIQFLFESSDTWIDHPRVNYVNQSFGVQREKFINTCDVILDVSKTGYTFSLLLAQASNAGKHIVAYNFPTNVGHLESMKDNLLDTFVNKQELVKLLSSLCTNGPIVNTPKWFEYNTKKVLTQFSTMFLS